MYYECRRFVLTKRTRLLQAASASLLLALAILLLPPGTIFHDAHASTVTIHLVAYYASGWNGTTNPNPTITVQQGDSVTIVWSNGDTGIPHQFLLDVDKDGYSDSSDCSPTADPCTTGMSTTGGSVTFTASKAGSYTYYCAVHPFSMVGSFVVSPAPGFSMASNPSSLTIGQSSSTTSTITLSSENGFTGAVNLGASVSPTGPTATMMPTSVSVSPGSPATSTLTVSTGASTPGGTYTVTVNGASDSTTNMTTVSVTVIVPDFSIASSPASLGVIQGVSSNSSTITLTSLNGFSGTVTLGSTVSQSGLSLSFNPTSVTISTGGSGTSTLTISTSTTPPGFYTATINGMSGSTTNTTTVNITVTIPDFNIRTSPPNLSITQGSTSTVTITIASLSGFKGTLTLTGSVSQPGPAVSFSPASVTLSSGGVVTSNMTVSAAGGTYNSVATGSYPVTITVTNGTLTHSTTVEVNVGSLPSGASSLPLTILIGAGAIIAAAGITIFLVRRRAGRNPQP
jgi:plastocyanin